MEDLFRKAMDGILEKVALQEIRKVIRGKDKESVKLEKIVTIVHSYEDDAERAELEAERRAIEEDEEKLRREKVNDIFDGIKEPLDKMFDWTGEVTASDNGRKD